MRLWSLHPSYLDSKGLAALWRESLLAQNVLAGRTKGYRNHPQLIRFKATNNPEGAIAVYLKFIITEANRRGYSFDSRKIRNKRLLSRINVSTSQLEYEFAHLLNKLKLRDPERYIQLKDLKKIEAHPIFLKVRGGIESWEII